MAYFSIKMGAFNISKIQDESKSQLRKLQDEISLPVLSIFQRYKMKSNHNNDEDDIKWKKGAFNISKIQDEIKSQR